MNIYLKSRSSTQRSRSSGFTIVELLVVIVVIAILAAITVVTFNGIQQRAADSALKSDIANTQRLVAAHHATEGAYPLAEDAVNDGQGFISSVDTTYEYTSDGAVFCLTATSQKAKKSYFINSDNSSPTDGACPGDTGYVAEDAIAAPKDEWLAVSSSDYDHTCGIGADQKVYCWGGNTYGQLGDGTQTLSRVPVAVTQGEMPANATVKSLSASNSHSCVVASDDNAYCWGRSNPVWVNSLTPKRIPQGAIPIASKIKEIDLHAGTVCVLTLDSAVYCWGYNAGGHIGNATTVSSSSPVAVLQGAIPPGVTIKDIDVGASYVCAVGTDDRIYCWGINTGGQLGDGSQTARTTPVQTLLGAMPSGGQVIGLSAGSNNTCAIVSGQRAYCWGVGSTGRNGDGTTTLRTSPVQIYQTNGMAVGTTQHVSIGALHTCSVDAAGAPYCWGAGSYGANGSGGNQTRPNAIARGAIPSSATITAVSAGNNVTCMIDNEKKLYCWGDNEFGQLGVGSAASSVTTPTEVTARP